MQHARTSSPAWLIGLAGVLLPGLRLLAAQQSHAGQRSTAETRVLGWFRASLAADDPSADQHIQLLLETALASP